MCNNTDVEVTKFFGSDYKDWAMSVIEERALPSVIDGFKPTARKVVHAAITGSLKDGALYKLLALSGDAMKLSLYAHGDASLNGVIINLCKPFVDSFNPLESDSQVGTVRDPNSAGSPRYLYVRHSRWLDLIYKTDYNLLDFVFEEGQYVEPSYYLPIIPTVLCKNNLGVAVGYAMHNLSRNPADVIDACVEYIKTGDIKKTALKPYIIGVNNKSWYIKDGHWFSRGAYSVSQTKKQVVITDLPYDTTYEGFEKLLNKMIENGLIKTWSNLSNGDQINYVLNFAPDVFKNLRKTGKLETTVETRLKLVKQAPDDLFWLLDENKKLAYFATPEAVIKYFTKFRLGVYKKRKSVTTEFLEKKFKENSDLVRFIELIITNKLKLKNRQRADIKADMDKVKLPITLLSTPMSRLTAEEVIALKEQNKEINAQLDYIKKTSVQDMYLNDLTNLKNAIKKYF